MTHLDLAASLIVLIVGVVSYPATGGWR